MTSSKNNRSPEFSEKLGGWAGGSWDRYYTVFEPADPYPPFVATKNLLQIPCFNSPNPPLSKNPILTPPPPPQPTCERLRELVHASNFGNDGSIEVTRKADVMSAMFRYEGHSERT